MRSPLCAGLVRPRPSADAVPSLLLASSYLVPRLHECICKLTRVVAAQCADIAQNADCLVVHHTDSNVCGRFQDMERGCGCVRCWRAHDALPSEVRGQGDFGRNVECSRGNSVDDAHSANHIRTDVLRPAVRCGPLTHTPRSVLTV